MLLLAVPACGLSDYEKLMRDAQEREEAFRAEQKYLGRAVIIPTRKDSDDKDVPIANVFFRPPRGIDSKPQQLNEPMWRYPADPRSNDFLSVDMAFGEDDKDFDSIVRGNYEGALQASNNPRQITPPGQTTPVTFDAWEFISGNVGVSINILRGSSKPVAIVYRYNKSRQETARKILELSLQSLGVDQKASAARQRANEKSPWKLEGAPSS
jgi:hypothetical protein